MAYETKHPMRWESIHCDVCKNQFEIGEKYQSDVYKRNGFTFRKNAHFECLGESARSPAISSANG